MMTTPASAIKDEVRVLNDGGIHKIGHIRFLLNSMDRKPLDSNHFASVPFMPRGFLVLFVLRSVAVGVISLSMAQSDAVTKAITVPNKTNPGGGRHKSGHTRIFSPKVEHCT
jgi:hypothetical protein